MQLLRRSDSNSRPSVSPAVGVPDHRVSKKQANEGVKNVTDSEVKPTLKRGHCAVDTLEVRDKMVDLPHVTETPKRSGLSHS